MSFAAPWMLLGLLLVGPLLWIHLKRRSRQTVAFPTLFILQRVMRQKQKQSKLRDWLIILLRALVIVVFSVALARPSLTVWRPGGIRSGLPLSQVILLDNSASMQHLIPSGGDETTTAFEQARQMAITEMGRLRPQDSVAVILAGRPHMLVTDGLTTDKEQVVMKLSGLKPGFGADAIDDAILKAEQLLAGSSSAQKEVLLITDLCARPASVGTLKSMRSIFRVVGVQPELKNTNNVAVKNVEMVPSGGKEAREVTIRTEIENYGNSPQTVDVTLTLDDKPVARGVLKLDARQAGVKAFHHRFDEKGIHFGHVKIADDIFEADNIRYLATNVRRAINVLVINGDSRPGSWLDEVFYLQKALETPIPGEVPVATQILTTDIAKVTPLDSFDVIFLAGVTEISAGLSERLERYLEDGGGLFISAANGELSENLKAVIPAEVDGVRNADRRKHFSVGAVNLSHPIFQTLHAKSTGLENVRIKKHLLLRPNPAVERKVLVQLQDGLPLLMEREIEKGSVMLLTTTIDRDWSDLPIRPGFLPLIQRSIRYLSRSLAYREPRMIDAGSSISLPVVDGMQKLIVLSPQNRRNVFSANRLTGQTQIRFKQTGHPGAYRVWAEMPESGGLTELQSSAFVVNIEQTESDLSPKMKESGELSRNDRNMYTALKGKLPIWSYLLLVGIFLLIFESIVAGMGLRKSHRKRVSQ